MKIKYTEHTHDYANYVFGYRVWGIPEPSDTLDSIYEQGFLPYSGTEFPLPSYYRCRSLRVDTTKFQLNSENRRILSKFDTAFQTSMVMPATAFAESLAFLEFGLEYFRDKHDANVMTKERLQAICRYDEHVWIRTYTDDDGNNVAYIIERHGEKSMHFWFSLYDTKFAASSFGMWLMTNCVRMAVKRSTRYVYLGTVYSLSSLYKTNFSGLEFWDGNAWSSDVKQLKTLVRSM